MRRSQRNGDDYDRLAWPLLLLLTILIPSAGVVWMMREAVRNEQLATGQRLREAYASQLELIRKGVQQYWEEDLATLDESAALHEPGSVFAQGVADLGADGLLVRDLQENRHYPADESGVQVEESLYGPDASRAQRLEFAAKDYQAAEQAYAELARSADDPIDRAHAEMARMRCLLALGNREAAIESLESLRSLEYDRNPRQRSVAAIAELRLLEILDKSDAAWSAVANQLKERLIHYAKYPMPSPQRQFLVHSFERISKEPFEWPTRAAEKLAAEFLPHYEPGTIKNRLQPTPLPGVWSCTSVNGRIVALFRTAGLRRRILDLANRFSIPTGLALVATGPQEIGDLLLDTSLGTTFGGWRLGLSSAEGDPFDAPSRHREAVHAWIALLIVAATCSAGWLLATALRRRLRLVRLKNDLVATVSHELKTPLSSIRLLVDTLLAEDHSEGIVAIESADGPPKADGRTRKTREYLQLISQENARLTRLIENFLTFSRMERGAQQDNFKIVDVREVVRQAAGVMRGRWGDASDCLHVDAGPPAYVLGDLDGLVAAVVNLLENAWKFTDPPKKICLIATANKPHVTITVSDNGIGLSQRATRRAFESFYQVDQRVARRQGGCGLGLSIVRAVARAHGGDAYVESQERIGSSFRICLPSHPPVREDAAKAAKVRSEQR